MASTDFINECKNRANSNRLGQLIVDGIETPISNKNNLQKISIDDSCYVDGNIIGSVFVKKLTAEFVGVEDNAQLVDKQLYAQIGVKYADNSTEYVEMGKYTIERPNDEKTANYSQITAYNDLAENIDKKYVCGIDYSQGSITVSDLYRDVCNQLGLTPKTLTFLNNNIPISNNPFVNGETNRTVLQSIGKVACSFFTIDIETNKIDLSWLSENEEPDYEFAENDYAILEGGIVSYGPINSVTIKNSVIDDENVTKKDATSISVDGEHSLTISEDYILYNTELRQQAITTIFNRLNGLKYVDCKLTTYYGKPFLKIGSKIRINSKGSYFDTYVLKHNFTYDGTFTSVIESPVLTEQQVKNKQEMTLQKKLTNTQIIVDKQNQAINMLASKQIDTSNEVNKIGLATLEDCMDTELYRLSIKGDITRQYHVVNQDNSTYPVYLDTYLIVESGEHKDRYNLPIDYLTHLENVYDEFLIENGQAKLIKRIGIVDNQRQVLAEPIETDLGTINIKLYEGTNTIYLESFSNVQLGAKYLIQNPYTKEFAKQVDLQAEINVRAEEVQVLAKAQSDTNTELQSEIKTRAEEVEILSKEKVGNDEIIAKINVSPETVKVNANKIELSANDILNLLAGNAINLTTKNITIEATNFSVDEEGNVIAINIKAINGNFSGVINGSIISGSTFKGDAEQSISVEIGTDVEDTVLPTNNSLVIKRNAGSKLLTIGGRYWNSSTTKQLVFYTPANFINLVNDDSTYGVHFTAGLVEATYKMRSPEFVNTSSEKIKKNIKSYSNGLGIIKNTDIYEYNYKDEKNKHKKHLGVVIGENYKTPKEIISEDQEGVDLYSMISVAWQAIKEQQEQIELLKKEIELLKIRRVI